jgi:hypothetical protein
MATALEFMLRVYQRWLSPLFPPACRYVPTCSHYAQEAVTHHGALRGSVLAAWRLLRCHPLARGGYDPCPLPHIANGSGFAHAETPMLRPRNGNRA